MRGYPRYVGYFEVKGRYSLKIFGIFQRQYVTLCIAYHFKAFFNMSSVQSSFVVAFNLEEIFFIIYSILYHHLGIIEVLTFSWVFSTPKRIFSRQKFFCHKIWTEIFFSQYSKKTNKNSRKISLVKQKILVLVSFNQKKLL